MTVQIQLRHDTAANWTAVNPVLAVGEAGVEIDTNKMKFGTGATAWNSLSYLTGSGGGSGVPTTTRVDTTAPLSGGGDLSANRTLAISDFTTTSRGAVPNPATTSGRFLKDDGTWALPTGGASGAGGVFPFTYNTSTLESITGSQLRGNNSTFASSTKLWISETTVDGLDVSIGLARIKLGFQIYVQDYTSASRYVQFNVTADAIDKGTYWEIGVASVASLGTIPGGKVALQSLSSAQTSSLFSTTTTAPGLTPGSNGLGTTRFLRADGTWVAPPGGGDMTLAGVQTITGAKTFGIAAGTGVLKIAGNLAGVVTLEAANAASGTITLPAAPGDTLVATALAQTLTNKTVDLASNTVTATLAQLNTAVTDGNLVANGGGVATIVSMTAAAYAALGTKDPNTLYVVT